MTTAFKNPTLAQANAWTVALGLTPPVSDTITVSTLGITGINPFDAYVNAAKIVGDPVNQSLVDAAHKLTGGYVETGMGGTSYTVGAAPSHDVAVNVANLAHTLVIEAVTQANAFVSLAASEGYEPPDNPYVYLSQHYPDPLSIDPTQIPDDVAVAIVANIVAINGLLAAYRSGEIDFTDHTEAAGQLSGLSVQISGLGGSGDAATDLAHLLPDADAIKERKAQDALGLSDFSKRKTKMLFSADYSPAGTRKGVLIGWKRDVDASGYRVDVHDVFKNTDWHVWLTNAQLDQTYSEMSDYVKQMVLSFKDDLAANDAYVHYVSDLPADSYFMASVQAYQDKIDPGVILFPLSPITIITHAYLSNVMARTQIFDPYAALAGYLLSNQSYDWVLAGLNTQYASSLQPPPTYDVIRQYAFMSATEQFLYGVNGQQGRGLVTYTAAGLDALKDAIKRNIALYGVNQVIYEILRITGALYFFENMDVPPNPDPVFTQAGKQDPVSSDFLASIMSSIDPETMLMDVSTLETNVATYMNAVNSSSPGELGPMPSAQTAVNIVTSALPSPSDKSIDLTTFDGISVFMGVIKSIQQATLSANGGGLTGGQ